jgi:hypothetical protein
MVQLPHKDTKDVIKIDAIAPALPHTHNVHKQCLKCFLSVLILTVLLHIIMTEELQQCLKNDALMLLNSPDMHFAARI